MESSMNYWPLLGVAVVIIGFALRFNALLVVMLAGVTTGLAAQMQTEALLAAIGSGFIKTLNLPLILLLPLPVVGLLERNGLKERAQEWIASIRMATAGRLLLVYLFVRELTAALGLTSLGGHPQMVRPLLAPMAEGAAEHRHPNLTSKARQRVRAMSAATDNVGLFFGEDVFVAFGAIMLMHTFLRENGVEVEPLHIALWGIPTAISAFIIHGIRLYRLDGWLAREGKKMESSTKTIKRIG
ncbi:TPA: DUF969 domain-containing protein [Aeromonas dhakensis]|uniref:DUF969 domain-containing protein n=1 Tax=Aeromonas dhakensis TaxID=196024 RepID=UPI0028913E86|nr:DUF969 domain-containing protein [Aeromonas dhakensis]